MKDNIMLIGLDFETSTGDHRNLSPIQIGISMPNGQEFESLIALPDEHVWSMNSQAVHGIEMKELEGAPSIFEVDIRASAFMFDILKEWSAPRMNRVAVGWNVGSFDRRIVYDYMPNLNNILSYRTLDLNTVCYFAADILGDSYARIKQKVKEEAAAEIGEDNWHNALFDARAGLLNYQMLVELVAQGSNETFENLIKQSVPK